MNGYNETNLRNPNAELIDWGFLNNCFGESKIKVSDIDGVVERNGSFLYLESKRHNETMKNGQKFTLEAFAREGHTVILIIGRPQDETMEFELWYRKRGKVIRLKPERYPQNIEGLQACVSDWYKKADSTRGWKWP